MPKNGVLVTKILYSKNPEILIIHKSIINGRQRTAKPRRKQLLFKRPHSDILQFS